MASALDGIRVLDFSVQLYGPLTSMMLGDMGADVIKVEMVQGHWEREPIRESHFITVNRNKRSLAVDIKSAEGREIVLKLVRTADVFLHSMRPGGMEKLGLGYDVVSAINPRTVYASLSGYGEQGPWARRISGDPYLQGMAGVVDVQGERGGHPYLCGVAFLDQGAPAIAAYGVALALFVRERTGKGQEISANLLHAAMHIQTAEIAEYLLDGKLLSKRGRGWACSVPPFGAYRAGDGRDLVTVVGRGIFGGSEEWSNFCGVLGVDHLARDPRFATMEDREAHREELYPLLDEAFASRTSDEWIRLFREAKMRVDPCLNYAELVEHPQVTSNEMVVNYQHPVRGAIRGISAPVKLKSTPGEIRRAAPSLGEHTVEILTELGYTSEEITMLQAAAVINTGVIRDET